MREHKWENRIGGFFMLLGAVLLGVSVFLCFSGDIWYDELFTMGLANQPLFQLVDITSRDVHPPLYYMIVRYFLLFSKVAGTGFDQVVIAKLASAIPFGLCFIYSLTIVRKHFGMLTAGLFCFLLTAMPQLAEYTVEIRMYGYALFFVTAAMLHAYEIVLGKSYVNWICLTLFALAACYTQYFACVAVCMVYGYLLVYIILDREVGKRTWKPFSASAVCCIIGYLPWLLIAVPGQVGSVGADYWIQPLSIKTLGGCVEFLFRPAPQSGVYSAVTAIIFFTVYAVLIASACIRLYQCRKGRRKTEAGKRGVEAFAQLFFAAGCLGVMAGLLLFGFAVSILLRPVFVYRYMLPAAGVFWLAFSVLTGHLYKAHRKLGVLLCLFLAIVGVWNYRSFCGGEMWKRVNMEKTKENLRQIKEQDLLICNFGQVQAVLSYYLPNTSYLWYEQPDALIQEMYPQNLVLAEPFSDETGISRLKEIVKEGHTVWFAGSGKAREEIIQKWEAEGISAQEQADMLLERYWFNLYLLKENQNVDDSEEKR